jgi:hypothetical protein
MTLDVNKLKSDLTGTLHGTNLTDVTNLSDALRRAALKFLSRINARPTARRSQVAFFQNVFDYAPPSDLKGDAVADIRPQFNRTKLDNFTKTGWERFDLEKADFTYTIENRDGQKVLRVARDVGGEILLEALDATTGWSVGGVATNLSLDNNYRVQGSASLQFDVANGNNYIEKTLSAGIDLSKHEDRASLFFSTLIPTSDDISKITSFELRWGSSSSAYWSRTITVPHFGSAFVLYWNLLRFDWNGTTSTGSPDETDIKYFRLGVNATGSITAMRFDGLYSRLPRVYEVVYYSELLFRDSNTGVFRDTPNTDDDLINVDTESYDSYLNECGYAIAQQARNADDVNFFYNELYGDGTSKKPGQYKQYEANNPDEEEPQVDSYYNFNNNISGED